MHPSRWLDDRVDTVTRTTMPIFGLRLAVAAAIGTLAIITLGQDVGFLWLLAAASAEVGTWITTRRTRRGLSQTLGQRLVYLAAIFWMNIVWSGLGVVLWLDGRTACVAAAVCMLATQMLHAQVFASRSPAVLLAVAAPPIAGLAALVLFATPGGWSEQALLSGAAAIMIAYMTRAGLTNAGHLREQEEAQTKAEQSAQAKARLLADMSHELRTPLTSILGFTRMIAQQDDCGTLTRSYLERVEDASSALLCAVNDILDFSKLEAGQLILAPEEVEAAGLARRTLDLLTPQAAAKDLRLVLESDLPADLRLMVDPARLRQVLLNLLGNAVKFTPAGEVGLAAAYDPETARLTFSVRDTGPGIAPERLDALFKRFSQVGAAGSRIGGTGLGLAICKGLVEAMGGEIGVESQPGAGSRFWFSVPAPAVRQGRIAVTGDGGEQETAPLAGLKILVVDDHPANRELASLFLGGFGAEVHLAKGGEAALRACAAGVFDVLLLDQHMPDLDGPETLRRLRRAKAAPPVVLAFTADPNEAAGRSALVHGVVPKPIDPVAMLTTILQALDAGSASGPYFARPDKALIRSS